MTVLQSVQIILAGNLAEIDMNPATNEPKANEWNSCRKMIQRQPHAFLKACKKIFDKFETDPYLDVKV